MRGGYEENGLGQEGRAKRDGIGLDGKKEFLK